MNNPQKKSKKIRQGFSLPEVLIAVLVLVLVVFASTSLLVGVMRSNNENIRTLQAFGLAQEALEGVRNIRDSNWLLGGRFNGTLGSVNAPVELWGAAFPSGSAGEKLFYTIDLGVLEPTNNLPQSARSLAGNTPWTLSVLLEDEAGKFSEATRLKRLEDERNGEVRYGHFFPLGEPEDTIFYRFVSVENISEDPTRPGMYRVAAVVKWQESGREKEVRLESVFTDWNEGQL